MEIIPRNAFQESKSALPEVEQVRERMVRYPSFKRLLLLEFFRAQKSENSSEIMRSRAI